MTSQNWCLFDRTTFSSRFRSKRRLSMVILDKNESISNFQICHLEGHRTICKPFRAPIKFKIVILDKNEPISAFQICHLEGHRTISKSFRTPVKFQLFKSDVFIFRITSFWTIQKHSNQRGKGVELSPETLLLCEVA